MIIFRRGSHEDRCGERRLGKLAGFERGWRFMKEWSFVSIFGENFLEKAKMLLWVAVVTMAVSRLVFIVKIGKEPLIFQITKFGYLQDRSD